VKLLEALHLINESHGLTNWTTTWTIPGREIVSFPHTHHEESAKFLIDKYYPGNNEARAIGPEDFALTEGWIRGGLYETEINTKIYIEFDEENASQKDVNRTVQYLRRLFKTSTGSFPDSVYTPSGEIMLRDLPTVISHLKEESLVEKFQDVSPELNLPRRRKPLRLGGIKE